MYSAMFLPRIIRSTCHALLDIIYPPLCLGCENILERHERFACRRCWQSIRHISVDDTTMCVLHQRLIEHGSVSRIFSVYYFEEQGLFQPIIHGLKYSGFTSLGFELGKHVGAAICAEKPRPHFDSVIPIPLHRSKQRERGYNQSEYIAQGISSVLNIRNIDIDGVRRVRPTGSQTHLTIDERKQNMENAFRAGKPFRLKGKHVLLVDDVITTGATIGECARVVKEAGAASVSVASVALARLTGEKTLNSKLETRNLKPET
jgi:ComF family protein